ncbi:Ferritin heavy chain [Camelus dromedarius]|uniref:Ferritin heavy chain n=1 Tax=Camelus dromedarius TaxID=9838 RepID=A0A5N4C302_CAMDR|nr:Ferritin heavy chain [Camelus dromedarius]
MPGRAASVHAVHLAPGTGVNQSCSTAPAGQRQERRPLCHFLPSHCLNQQVEFIKELGDHITTLKRWGPGSRHVEYLFNKLTWATATRRTEPGLHFPMVTG